GRHLLLFEKPLYSADKSLRFSSARSGFQQVRRAPMLGSALLFTVEILLLATMQVERHRRQQERVEQLKSYHIERRAEAGGDVRRRHSFIHVQPPRDGTWQKEFTGEEIHLDFAPLAAAVVDDAIDAYGCGLRWSSRIRH